MTQIVRRLPFAAAALATAALVAGCSAAVTVPLVGRVGVTVEARQSTTAGQGQTAASTSSGSGADPSTQTSTSGSGAAQLEEAFVQVVQRTGPSVVEIQSPGGLGSGVVFDEQGDVVTNAHVVESGESFTVTASTGSRYPARLVGIDAEQDLAVIRVEGGKLTPARFADSSRLQVGDVVLALGSPFGLQGSVTQGLVSALDRSVRESRQVTLSGLIQTSAPINPGNSGGALSDLDGQVVGIPTLGASSAEGIGFAIPSNEVVSVAKQLIGQR